MKMTGARITNGRSIKGTARVNYGWPRHPYAPFIRYVLFVIAH